MPSIPATASGTARNRLGAAAAFGAFGLTLSAVYAFGGIGIPCPWRNLTHTLCPFCGATTMGARLLHGDFAGAWSANQFVFVLLAGVTVACLAWAVELLGGPVLRLPRWLGDQHRWYLAGAVAAVAFGIIRNVVALA